MARGRMISKTLGTSRKFRELQIVAGKLGEFAQSLYPLLVASSDDFGREPGDSFTVKHAVFPTSPRSEEHFEDALQAMERVGLIRRYGAPPSGIVLQINDFEAHQQGLHKRSKSQFPDPEELPGNSGNAPEIPSEPNLTEPKGTKDGEGAAAPRAAAPRAARRVPEDLAYDEDRKAEAIAAGLDTDSAAGEWAKFIDHEFARPRRDWPATWRNWCRRAVEGMGAHRPLRPVGRALPAGMQSIANFRAVAGEK